MLFGVFSGDDEPVPAWRVYFCAAPADVLAELDQDQGFNA